MQAVTNVINVLYGLTWNLIYDHLRTVRTDTHRRNQCQGISFPMVLSLVIIHWKVQGLALSWWAAATFMAALAGGARDLAFTLSPSVPATAARTPRRKGLVLQPFLAWAALSGSPYVRCFKKRRSPLLQRNFSAIAPPEGVNRRLLDYQGCALTEWILSYQLRL